MESFKDVNLLKLVVESFTLGKAKDLLKHSKSTIMSTALLKILNLKKLFRSTGKSKHTFKFDKLITSVTRCTNINIITTLEEDATLKIINMNNYNCLQSIPNVDFEYISSMVLLPNGNIVYSTFPNTIKEVDPRKDFSCVNFVDLNGYNSLLNLVPLPNGRIAFSAHLWDKGSHIFLLDFNDKYNIIKLFKISELMMFSLISLTNNRFACALNSGIMIWDTGNNGYTYSKILNRQEGFPSRCLLYISEYDSLVAGSSKTIDIWDMSNYEPIYTIKEKASCLLYLPNGYFASSFWKVIKIWNLVNFQCVSIFEGHEEKISFLLVLKDNRIVSASDTEIIIWENS
jgi:hypothetical protein